MNSDNNLIIIIILYFYLYFFKNKFFLYIIFIFIEVNFSNNLINIFDINKNYFELNSKLTNGLILIHPILLYFGVINLIFFSFENSKFFFYSLIFFFKKKNYFFYLNSAFIIFYISIFLGSLWAEQELSWGGWWNWDVIEIISLNYLIIVIFLIHCTKKFFLNNLFFIDIFFKIFLFFSLVKLNFLNSIHNFVSIDFFFQNFYEIIILYFLLYSIIVKTKLFKINFFFKKKNYCLISLTFVFLSFNNYIYIYNDFLTLFYKESNFIFFKKGLFLLNLFFLFYFLNFFNNYKFLNIFFLTFWEYIFFSFLNIFLKKKNLYKEHLIIFIFFFLLNSSLFLYKDFFDNFDIFINNNFFLKDFLFIFDKIYVKINSLENFFFNFEEINNKNIFFNKNYNFININFFWEKFININHGSIFIFNLFFILYFFINIFFFKRIFLKKI